MKFPSATPSPHMSRFAQVNLLARLMTHCQSCQTVPLANKWLCSILYQWKEGSNFATGETSALVHCPTRAAARSVGVLIASWFDDLRVVTITAEVSGSQQMQGLTLWKGGNSVLVGTSTVAAGLDNTKCSLVVGLYAHHSLDQLVQVQARCGRRDNQQHTAYFLYVDAEQKRIIANAVGSRGLGDLTQSVIDSFDPGSYMYAKAQLLYRPEGVRAAANQRMDQAGVGLNAATDAVALAEVFSSAVCRRRLPWVLLDEVKRPSTDWFEANLDCGSQDHLQLPCDVCGHWPMRLHDSVKDSPIASFGLPDDPNADAAEDQDDPLDGKVTSPAPLLPVELRGPGFSSSALCWAYAAPGRRREQLYGAWWTGRAQWI